MFLVTLTSYGQSIISDLVTIDSVVLLYEQVSDLYNFSSSDLLSKTIVYSEEAHGNLKNSVGNIFINDFSNEVYQAKTIIFCKVNDNVSIPVAGYSQSTYIINKSSSGLSISVPFDFSAFTNGFSFSSIQAGYSTALQNIDGLLHLYNPDILSDDSYSVYSKVQVDNLIPTVPTSVSAFTNDVGYLTSHQQLKTINGQSLIGTGNITISGTGGGDTNIIESISVNGITQTVTNKNVDVTVPTKVSDLNNDSGFITSSSLPTVNNTTITIKKNVDDTGDSFTTNASSTKVINLGLSAVATSGSYTDLSNKPTIPTNISAFNNDAGYISQIKTINNQSLIGTGDITITSGGDYATYIGNSEANYVAYSNNVASNGKALLPYTDAADSVGYVDLGSSTNRWRNAYIKDAIYLSDSSASIKGYTNLLRLHTQNGSNTWTSITTDIISNQLRIYSYTGSTSTNHITHDLIDATPSGISLYDNHVNITSTETTFNKDVDLVLAKDTNTYIYSGNTLSGYDYRSWWANYDQPSMSYTGISICMTEDGAADSTLEVPINELSSVIPFGKLIVDNSNPSPSIGTTSVTDSLKDLIESGSISSSDAIILCFDSSTPTNIIGVVICAVFNQGETTSENLMFFIPSDDLEIVNYESNPGKGTYFIINNSGSYSLNNDYNFYYRVISKKSIKDYLDNKIESRINQGVTDAEYATYASQVGVYGANNDTDYPLIFTSSVTSSIYGLIYKNVYTDTSNDLYYNPSTNTLTCSTFSGDLSGTATKATQDGNGNVITSYYCTLSTEQTITGNKTFNSNVHITTDADHTFYVTGYDDQSGIRFGDAIDSTSYPMIVGETMSTTRCDLRQNYYVNNNLAGTIQTQCDSDGILITTSGLGRSSSTTGKWSLGTSDYRLSSVYAYNFYGDLQGKATDATNAENVGILGRVTPGNYPLIFTDSINSGTTYAVNKILYTDIINALTYNPNTATLTCETFNGNATTATTATTAETVGVLGNSTSSNYPLVFANSVNSSTTSAVNKRLYTDTANSLYYNPSTNILSGLFAIPYGSASLSSSIWTVSSPTPNPTTSADPPSGAIVCVYFSNYNSVESPQFKFGSWNAKPLYRTSAYAGIGANNSWPAGSVVLLRYNGSNWRLLNNNSYPTSTASGTTNIIPSTDNTYDLGSSSYRWNNLYAYYVGDSSTKVQYGYFNYCSISTLRNGSNSNLATLTTAGIIPTTDSTSSTTGFDLGSSSYKWKSLYISGGHSNKYIVIDNDGSEPTIRPDTDNYGYLGSDDYHWYNSYINNLYLGQSAVPLPPIAARSNTQLGSIQFLRVAIPANTTTGIRDAGTALSSSSYTLMLVTASTGATYLSFRNNTAPSGTWTTLTDMYYYNSTTSVVYTYVLAYKSA